MQAQLEAHEAWFQSLRRQLDVLSVTEVARASVDVRQVKVERALSESADQQTRELETLREGHHDLACNLGECREWVEDWADQIASVPDYLNYLEDRIADLEYAAREAGLGEFDGYHSPDEAGSYLDSAASTTSSAAPARARGRRSQGSSGSGSGPGSRKGKNRGGRGGSHKASGPGPPRDPHAVRTAEANGSAALAALDATLSPESFWLNFPDRW